MLNLKYQLNVSQGNHFVDGETCHKETTLSTVNYIMRCIVLYSSTYVLDVLDVLVVPNITSVHVVSMRVCDNSYFYDCNILFIVLYYQRGFQK